MVIRPIEPAQGVGGQLTGVLVNHSAPSEPVVMSLTCWMRGFVNVVTTPAVEIRPIELPLLNHTAPFRTGRDGDRAGDPRIGVVGDDSRQDRQSTGSPTRRSSPSGPTFARSSRSCAPRWLRPAAGGDGAAAGERPVSSDGRRADRHLLRAGQTGLVVDDGCFARLNSRAGHRHRLPG